jgi:hypothetical protein
MADIDYLFYKQVVASRPSAQKCYQVLWKDSANATLQANYFATTAADNYFKPGVLQWGAAPNPRACVVRGLSGRHRARGRALAPLPAASLCSMPAC